MAKMKDLTGQRFGRLLVIRDSGERKHGYVIWQCRCDCGSEVNVISRNLIVGDTKSCGCYSTESRQRRRPQDQKVSDEKLIKLYAKYRNIWKVADKVGVCGQSIHQRLVRLGIPRQLERIADEEIRIVSNYYKNTPDSEFDRSELLRKLPKETTVSRLEHIVGKCGIGNHKRGHNDKNRKRQSESKKGVKVPHDGFTGHKHTVKSKQKISKNLKSVWSDPTSIFNSKEFKEKRKISSRLNGCKAMFKNPYSRCKQGYYEIPGRGSVFFRSKWEANYALYLTFLKKHNAITSWEYEAKRFKFPVESGVVFYTPDFKIENLDGSIEWHEVKGWLDAKSKTKIKRMGKYYPDEKLVVIGEKEYKELSKMGKLYQWYQ